VVPVPLHPLRQRHDLDRLERVGTGYELHIIAAVVLGGTALFGGIGTIWGTVLGILTIGVIENGMVLIGADFHLQRVLIGILLIVAVAYQGWRRRRQGTAERI
jgi:ribose transport system permease protein